MLERVVSVLDSKPRTPFIPALGELKESLNLCKAVEIADVRKDAYVLKENQLSTSEQWCKQILYLEFVIAEGRN